jgi:hypothetical protein
MGTLDERAFYRQSSYPNQAARFRQLGLRPAHLLRAELLRLEHHNELHERAGEA